MVSLAVRLSAVCVLLLCGAGNAFAGGSPSTSPEVPQLSDARFAGLAGMCQKARQVRWGEPIIETFAKAPEKGLWTAQSGKLSSKDGKLLLTVEQQHGMGSLSRPLPAALRGSSGVRIELWVQALPMNIPGQANMRNFQNSMFLTQAPVRTYQYDYQYYYAMGPNGQMHQFTGAGTGQSENLGQVKPGKLIHAVMEILGTSAKCSRDGGKPLKLDVPMPREFRIDEQMHLGLMCYSSQFAIVQVAYRGLEPDPAAALTAADWKNTSFAGPTALTDYLLRDVVPWLDDDHYPTRQAASNLLSGLLPLSRPAVDAARKRAKFRPEGQTRLESLASEASPVRLVPRADEVQVKAPTAKDLPFKDDQDEKEGDPLTTMPDE